MSLHSLIFYFFMFMSALSAIGIMLTSNVFKAALFLLSCLLSLAALYVFAFAEFVAITQIMIYAGGVVVIIIFGIMLTTKISGTALKVENTRIFSGVLGAGALLFILVRYLRQIPQRGNAGVPSSNTIADTGEALITTYVLPFELAGILLLMALVGAAVIAKSIDKRKT